MILLVNMQVVSLRQYFIEVRLIILEHVLRTTLAKLHPFFPELAHLFDLDPAVEVLILREIVRAILTHIFHLRDDVSLLIGIVALHAASLVLAFDFLEN